MALAVTTLTSGIDTTTNPTTTASINPTASSLTLLWIGYAVAGGGTTTNTDTTIPTGARGTWTFLEQVDETTIEGVGRRGLRLYAGTGSVTNEAITITATCGSGTWTETAWIVDEWTGQDATPYDTAVRGGAGSGTSGALPDVGTPGTGDRVTGVWFHETDETVSGTGLTALGSVTGGSDLRTLHSFYDASDPQSETPTATWSTSSTWGGIALVINAAAGGGSSIAPIAYHHTHQ